MSTRAVQLILTSIPLWIQRCKQTFDQKSLFRLELDCADLQWPNIDYKVVVQGYHKVVSIFTSKLSSHYIFALTKGSWPWWPGHGDAWRILGILSIYLLNFLKLSSPLNFLQSRGIYPDGSAMEMRWGSAPRGKSWQVRHSLWRQPRLHGQVCRSRGEECFFGLVW